MGRYIKRHYCKLPVKEEYPTQWSECRTPWLPMEGYQILHKETDR